MHRVTADAIQIIAAHRAADWVARGRGPTGAVRLVCRYPRLSATASSVATLCAGVALARTGYPVLQQAWFAFVLILISVGWWMKVAMLVRALDLFAQGTRALSRTRDRKRAWSDESIVPAARSVVWRGDGRASRAGTGVAVDEGTGHG